MSVFVTDTHPVVWFTLNKHRDLSPKVLAAFQAAAAGNGFIYVPAVGVGNGSVRTQRQN